MTEQSQAQQILGPADQPFETTDGIKALTFYLLGFDQFSVNSYTDALLKSLGYSGRGLDVCQAAMQAVKDGKRGKLRFVFRHAPSIKLQHLYEQQEKQFTDKEKRDARVVLDQLINDFQSHAIQRDEFMVRLFCLLFKLRSEFMNDWKDQVPMVRVMNPGRSEVKDVVDAQGRKGKEVAHPGFTEISALMSDESKKRFGLI